MRVQVLSSFEDKPGSLIVDEDEIVEQEVVSGIAYSRDESKITLTRVPDEPGSAAQVFGSLAKQHINVDMQLADACDYPLHIGITEAGGQRSGTIKSSIGLGNLLWAGIGDTVRVSLSCDPVEEIKVGYEILKSLGLRHRGVNVVSCPSCARQQFDVIETVRTLEERLEHISTPLTVSVIGCVVNGPGEATLTDVGFTGGGRGTHQVYVNGLPSHRLKDEDIVDHLVKQVEAKAAEIEAQKDTQRKAEAEDTASAGPAAAE